MQNDKNDIVETVVSNGGSVVINGVMLVRPIRYLRYAIYQAGTSIRGIATRNRDEYAKFVVIVPLFIHLLNSEAVFRLERLGTLIDVPDEYCKRTMMNM